jgi:hypothetical protein
MMNFKVDKKTVLTGLSAVFGIGSFVVNILTKNDETNAIAEKAAKIAMEQLSKNK